MSQASDNSVTPLAIPGIEASAFGDLDFRHQPVPAQNRGVNLDIIWHSKRLSKRIASNDDIVLHMGCEIA